jgi:hypothetical protein
MSEIRSLVIPFLIGGTVITTVKFAATKMSNPALAAIMGGLPTGLISIYFLTADKSVGYAHNYFFVTLILATAIMVFYLLSINTALDKNIIWGISVATWALLVASRYFYSSRL